MKLIYKNQALVGLAALLFVGCAASTGLGAAADHLAARRYDKAEAAYMAATKKEPLQAWRGVCEARLLAGRFEAALAACEQAGAAEGGADNVSLLVLRGRTLRALGRHAEAVEALEKAHGKSPNDRAAVAWLAMSLGDALKRGEAVTTLRSWVDLVPDNAVRWAELASLQHYVYDLDDAEKSWRKVLDLAPTQAAAYVGIGYIHLFRGDVEEASRAATQALEGKADHVYAGALMARVEATSGKKDEARKRIDAVAPVSTASVGLLLERAAVLRLIGDAEGSLAALDAAASHDASDERIYYERGLALEAKGELPGALKAFDAAVAIRPFHLEALWRAALVSEKAEPDRYVSRVYSFLTRARDVAAVRPWVDDALARVPGEGMPPTPVEPSEPETTPASAPASAPAAK